MAAWGSYLPLTSCEAPKLEMQSNFSGEISLSSSMLALIPERGDVFCLTVRNDPCNHHELSVSCPLTRWPLWPAEVHGAVHGPEQC